MIAYADSFSGQYADRLVFMRQIIGRLAIEARRRGWPGEKLVEVRWISGQGAADTALVVIDRGDAPLTVDAVRDYLKRNRGGGK